MTDFVRHTTAEALDKRYAPTPALLLLLQLHLILLLDETRGMFESQKCFVEVLRNATEHQMVRHEATEASGSIVD
ncbi:hypothetical protein V6N12_018885 [Hibiscus sabdariffa]|uniref:Uncharacterized protein n=1 Tax=Hibiscus sabdariffa TaxID=183260 RepID=A0ABR2AU26_9ROSI